MSIELPPGVDREDPPAQEEPKVVTLAINVMEKDGKTFVNCAGPIMDEGLCDLMIKRLRFCPGLLCIKHGPSPEPDRHVISISWDRDDENAVGAFSFKVESDGYAEMSELRKEMFLDVACKRAEMVLGAQRQLMMQQAAANGVQTADAGLLNRMRPRANGGR